MADNANPLEEYREDFSLLLEAGFVAVKQLDEMSATRLFNAAQAISPKSTAPKIGFGYIALNKLETKVATKTFEEVVQEEPENYLAQTLLGICYLLNKPKRKKGEELIRNAIEKSNDETVKNLGNISLEWSEKELGKQKSKSPFFASKDESDKDNEDEKIPKEEKGKKKK